MLGKKKFETRDHTLSKTVCWLLLGWQGKEPVITIFNFFTLAPSPQDPILALIVSGWIINNTNIVLRQCGCGHSAGAHPLPIGENTYSPGGLDLTSCVAIPLWRLKCFLHRRRQARALALIEIIA